MRYARMSGTLQLHVSVNGSDTSHLGKSELVALVLSVIDWQGSDLLALAQGNLVKIVDLYLHQDGRVCSALGILVFMHFLPSCETAENL